MKKLVTFILLCSLLIPLIGCIQTPSSSVGQEITVEVEVTRFATVQVPVEVTREILIELTPDPIPIEESISTDELDESEERDEPIDESVYKILFPPTYPLAVLEVRAGSFVEEISDIAGVQIEAVYPQTSADYLEELCAESANIIALADALTTIYAQRTCDAQPSITGIVNQYPHQFSMLIIPRLNEGPRAIAGYDDMYESIWGASNEFQMGTYYFQALFAQKEIPLTPTIYDTDSNAMIAMADEQVNFATARYIPPILPYDERQWEYGRDNSEIWGFTGFPIRSGIGFIVVGDYVERGGYQVRDARANVLDVRENIFYSTVIYDLSEPLPNEGFIFGADVAVGKAEKINNAIREYVDSDVCQSGLCSADYLAWDGAQSTTHESLDPIRFIFDTLELTAEEILP